MPTEEKFDFSDIVDAPGPASGTEEFDFSDLVDTSLKKKDDTRPSLTTPSTPSVFKSASKSEDATGANAVYGVSEQPPSGQKSPIGASDLPDFNNPKYKQQQEVMALNKKMFETINNKKLNIERKKEIEPALTSLGDKIKVKQKEIDQANHVVATTQDPNERQSALQSKAQLEQEHDLMSGEFNKVAGQYNTYNKAVVQDEKLSNVLTKELHAIPAGNDSKSAAAIFGKSIYNATLPALVKSIGTTVNVLGEVANMLPGSPDMPEGIKDTDAIGNALTSWGDAIKTDVPSEAHTDIWEKPSPENVAATAGNLIGNLATVIGSGGVGGAAAAGSVGMALGVDESFSAAKSAGLSDKDAAKIALPVGIVNGLLDVVGVESILTQFEKKAINKALAKEAIDYLKDKEITQASAIEAVQFAQKEVMKKAAKGAFKTASTEAVTGGAQAATQIGAEEVFDAATGQDNFKNTPKSALADVVRNGILEAAGGGLAGGVFNANPSTSSIYDKAQEINSNEGGMDTFIQEVDSHVRAGEITPEQGENVKAKVNNLIEVNNTVPAEISDKGTRVEAIEMIQEKNALKDQIDQIDPALVGDRKKTVTEIEGMLKHIADGTQKEYSYKLDADTGKYYEVKGDKETEITKPAFDLAIKYRPKAKETVAEPVSEATAEVQTPNPNQNENKAQTEDRQAEVLTENDPGAVTPAEVVSDSSKETPEAIPTEERSGVTHAQTAKIREELGMGEYEKTAEKQADWEQKADEEIAKGYDAPKLLSKIERGATPTPVEQKILAKYIATQKAIVSEDPSDENLAKLKKAIDVSETAAGTAVAKSLAARAGSQPVNKSVADFFIEQMEALGVEQLTEEQKKQNSSEFKEISAAEIALQQKIAELESENNRLRAEQEIKGVKRVPRKTREDFVKERKNIVNDIREKLRKSRGELSATPLPYAKEIIVIAPDVVRLMRSYVEEGITKLSDITKAIHDEFKQDIPDLTEKDVNDIIAGKYNEKKATRNEIAAKLKDLRDEAILLNKLEALEKGGEPKTEKARQERNKNISDLQKKIKDHDVTKIEQAKKNIKNQTAKLEEDLRTGNYEKVEKKKLELDKEGIALKDKLIKARQERQVRLMKDAYLNRSKTQKAYDAVTEVMNVPRAIMSSMDFSAPLRQGLIPTVSHPTLAAKAFKTMFEHALSEKSFDRWFYDLKESPEYQVMKQSKLYVADPHDPVLSAKEEQFMTNLASKIPFLGTKLIKGSERAYVSYLNKMRVDVFKRYMDAFEADGKTFENSPELYKEMANYVNAATGRGNLGALENSAQNLATLFFSPRLIASRLNLLTNPINPKFYLDTPKEVRVEYFKDMAKFVGVGVMTLALAKLAGADVEDDPRASAFGKIKVGGDTYYDTWGGFVQYIRLAAQLISGQTKTGKHIQELDTKDHNRGTVLARFGRQKLAPLPATGINLVTGYDFMGEHATVKNELERMLPLTPLDIAKAVKDEGIKSLFTIGVPATFGIGVNRYKDKTYVKPDDNTITGIFEIKDYTQKNYRQKKIFIDKEEKEVTKAQEDRVNELRNKNAETAIKKVLPALKKMPADVFKETVNIIYNQYEKEAKREVFGDKWGDKASDGKTGLQKQVESKNVQSVLNSIPKFRVLEQQEKYRKALAK